MPISSSGHLVLLQMLWKMDSPEGIAFDVLLHAATLLAVVIVYHRDIIRLFTDRRREAGLLIVGTVPAGVLGILLKDTFKDMADNAGAVGVSLAVTGIVLLITGWYMKNSSEERRLDWKTALIIGAAQAAAIMPGISRSGMTISAGILCGLALTDAVRFSFLLAVPVILGGVILELKGMGSIAAESGWVCIITGFLAALAFGLLALRIVLLSVQKKKFPYFGYYCLPMGIGVVIVALLGR